MAFRLSEKEQRQIIAIKINEIEMCDDYSDKDKDQLTKYYRKQLRNSGSL